MKHVATSPLVEEQGLKRRKQAADGAFASTGSRPVVPSRYPVELEDHKCAPHGYPFMKVVGVVTRLLPEIVTLCQGYFEGDTPHWADAYFLTWSLNTKTEEGEQPPRKTPMLATDLTGTPRNPSEYTRAYLNGSISRSTTDSVQKGLLSIRIFHHFGVFHTDNNVAPPDLDAIFRQFRSQLTNAPSEIRECWAESSRTDSEYLRLDFTDPLLLRTKEWKFSAEVPVTDLIKARAEQKPVIGSRCTFEAGDDMFEHYVASGTATYDFDVATDVLTIHVHCFALSNIRKCRFKAPQTSFSSSSFAQQSCIGSRIVAPQPPAVSMSYALQLRFNTDGS